jgi:monofunctional biosynthetic peptidoglycan transglycosylase
MKILLRWLGLTLLALIALQLFFVLRIACMAVIDPQSTTFERSQAWRIAREKGALPWHQQWVDYRHISDHLKRAVIASEDDGFTHHDGVDWNAIEKAWEKNAKAEQRLTMGNNARTTAPAKNTAAATRVKPPKIVGGSTITQQLAKNLLLSGERNFVRKGQEFVLTLLLESLLTKQRILEIYLNNVEWGEGVFGAQAASLHYFRKPASALSAYEAARLAVMLPRPRYFEKLPHSAYLAGRAGVITARMADAQLP